MLKTKIYSVFPGVGKTHLFNNSNGLVISDSDSSLFSWIVEQGSKVRNPEFPNNYIKHIESLIGKVDVILVSTHKEVIQGLIEAGIDFKIIYPNTKLKAYYLERYTKRGSDESFIELMDEMWDVFIMDIKCEVRVPKIELQSKDEYLSDVIVF